MKKIIITDPCYTDGGKKDIDNSGNHCKVTLKVTNKFFEVLKQKPEVDFNPKDNWDGGTYWFGGRYPIEDYIRIGSHDNDAGMTCIADYYAIKKFDWGDFCDEWETASDKKVPCCRCNGTGKKDLTKQDKEDIKALEKAKVAGDEFLIEYMEKCNTCYGSGEMDGRDLRATLNDHGHFLMVGSTFLGDVGATVYAHYNKKKEIDALAIDVVGYSFGTDEEEEDE